MSESAPTRTSTASNKSRLAVARSTSGQAFLAWSDDRADSGDVLAQNVTASGMLGVVAVVPALPEWGLVTLATILGLVGFMVVRQGHAGVGA